MRNVALAVSLLLSSCGKTPSNAVTCEALVADRAFIERCLGGDLRGQYVGDEECYPFSEEREYRGILITGFEWSEFYPNIDAYNEADRENPTYWFEQRAEVFHEDDIDEGKCTHDCAFTVSFVGRESICDAHFGHLGGYPKKVIAERNGQLRQLNIAHGQ